MAHHELLVGGQRIFGGIMALVLRVRKFSGSFSLKLLTSKIGAPRTTNSRNVFYAFRSAIVCLLSATDYHPPSGFRSGGPNLWILLINIRPPNPRPASAPSRN